MPRVDKTCYVDPSCLIDGDVRIFDESILSDCTITGMEQGQVLVVGSELSGITVEATDGQYQFRNAICTSDDDWFTIRPDGDPFRWVCHRTHGGWVVNAGCVRDLDATDVWDPTTAPDPHAAELVAVRQATWEHVMAECHRRT